MEEIVLKRSPRMPPAEGNLSSQPGQEKLPSKHGFSSSPDSVSALINSPNQMSKSTNQSSSHGTSYFGICPDGPQCGRCQCDRYDLAGLCA